MQYKYRGGKEFRLCSAAQTNIDKLDRIVAASRNLPTDWFKRRFQVSESCTFEHFRNAEFAEEMLMKHITSDAPEVFSVLVDSDCDGYCSGATVVRMINELLASNITERSKEVRYILHTSRVHGITSDIEIPNNTTMLIIPDAGSNDVEQCKLLAEKGIDILILDHHPMENPEINRYACVINCKDGSYPNPNLCGTGVAELFYKHIMKRWSNLDIAGVATVADVVESTNDENMFFIQNVNQLQTPLFYEILRKHDHDSSDVTVEEIKFTIAPDISAIIRIGTLEEKELLFKSLLNGEEWFDYFKRGSFDVVKESIHERVARIASNAKARQKRAVDKAIETIRLSPISCMVLGEVDSKYAHLTGLIAANLSEQHKLPCVILAKNDKGCLRGSGRNFDGSLLTSLKDALDDSQVFDYVQGHDNAFGVNLDRELPANSKDPFFESITTSIAKHLGKHDISEIDKSTHLVDFYADWDDIDTNFVTRMTEYDFYSAKGFPQVTALIKGIVVNSETLNVGKSGTSWKVSNGEVSFVKFKLNESDSVVKCADRFDDLVKPIQLTVDATCTFSMNKYNGVFYPQCIVKDYEIIGVEPYVPQETKDDYIDI